MKKKLRKILAIGLLLAISLTMFFGLSLTVRASNVRKTLDVVYRDVKIVIDGIQITPRDVNGTFVEPFIYQGTTYLPVRAVTEALGEEVGWNQDTGAVSITTKAEKALYETEDIKQVLENSILPVPEGGTNAHKSMNVIYRDIHIFIDGQLVSPTDVNDDVVEPFLITGTTYVPIRAVAEALGKEVDWDQDTATVTIFDPKRTDVTVQTAGEFIAAIGPNCNILLAPGEYNLSAASLRTIGNKYISWVEEFDGWQLNVSNVKNLTIRGTGDKPAELIVDPRYTFVTHFSDMRNLTIENVSAGHSEGGYCVGGVFAFVNCAGVLIDKTQMYGCGTTGLEMQSANGVTVRDSSVYECTYSIMSLEDCQNALFDKCQFYDNQEYTLIDVDGSKNILFNVCEFRENRVLNEGYSFFSAWNPNMNIVVKTSKFIDNDVKELGGQYIQFENCTFDDNLFAKP